MPRRPNSPPATASRCAAPAITSLADARSPDPAATPCPAGNWSRTAQALSKTFNFDDYYRTMAFVNALAFIAHREDHHPDLGVHYDRVRGALSPPTMSAA